jgi:hypothetical protein
MHAGSSRPAATVPSSAMAERYHYSMTVRVRPLLLFWISTSGVGDAVVTKRRGPDEAAYSLLIGSDPERAPRRINRWGYIAEEIHGAHASLIGLMTESDEQSVEEAEASIRRQAAGDRIYQIILATIDGDRARSVVAPMGVPAEYSFRHAGTVVDLARRKSSDGQVRIVRVPAGTRPGFLCALADLIHQQAQAFHASGSIQPGAAIDYVYHGLIYELRATRADVVPKLRLGSTEYHRVIAADFEIKNTSTGELTDFSMTYGTEGSFAEVPLTMAYQPRWWMQVALALDDVNLGN